uniref:Transmembrane protein Vc569 n=1 Tax=Phallusia mammillata TaxID=59560 RepID=A0A6F9DBT2_9ASCI|nr:transmembrane protein Vc569 [Phallusia mammillata]
MELALLRFFFIFAACAVVMTEGISKCVPACGDDEACVVNHHHAVCKTKVDNLVDVLCQALSCVNGTCQKVLDVNEHGAYIHPVCDCNEGFVGAACDLECPSCQKYEKCSVSEKTNNTICVMADPAGWGCTEETCLNGGSCNDVTEPVEDLDMCDCPEYYGGVTCETLICAETCTGTDICTMKDGKPKCISLLPSVRLVNNTEVYGWNCSEVTCHNNGTCNDFTEANENTTMCDCLAKYEGVNCELLKKGGRQSSEIGSEIDESVCDPNPCGGDCVCEPSCKHELGYFCVSEEGFIGKNCDIGIPLVTCGENEITIEVSTEFYEQFDKNIGNSIFYVSPLADDSARCYAFLTQFNTFQVNIPLPFMDCMTEINTDNVVASGIAFMNKLWINRNTGGAFDMPVPVVNFTCIYAREYTATTSLMPLVDEHVVFISKSGQFDAEFSLCKQQICDSSCPSYLKVQDAAIYTVGQMIHFNLKIITKQNMIVPEAQFVTTLEKVFLSCSPDRFDTSSILTTVATAGCPLANQAFSFMMTSGMTSTPQSVCGSIQVPRATTDNCKQIYIHAEILLCMTGDLQPCLSDGSNNFCINAARKRRSTDEDNVAFALIGPITIIPGSEGRRIEDLHLDGTKHGIITFADDIVLPVLPVKPKHESSPVTTEPNDVTYYSPMILIIGIICFTISCVTMMVFILSRLYRSRVELRHHKATELLSPTA